MNIKNNKDSKNSTKKKKNPKICQIQAKSNPFYCEKSKNPKNREKVENDENSNFSAIFFNFEILDLSTFNKH